MMIGTVVNGKLTKMCIDKACEQASEVVAGPFLSQCRCSSLQLLASGVGKGEAGSAAAPPIFGAGEHCSPGSLSMWQTDGDDYLQVGHQHSFLSALFLINKTCRPLRRRWCCATFNTA